MDVATIPVSVLVVDDRPQDRNALRAILASPDYRVVEATTGLEALRRLLDDEFAVLLVDVAMPDMSGIELAELVRARERTAVVPIVLMSAHGADHQLVYRGYQAG